VQASHFYFCVFLFLHASGNQETKNIIQPSQQKAPPPFFGTMDVSDVEGWGLAINDSCTLLATTNSLSEVTIYSIDDGGLQKPDTPAVTFRGQDKGVMNPRQVFFVDRGGVETLLLADFGSHKYAYVAEISTAGEFIRNFSVFAAFGKGKKGLKAFSMAYSPCGDGLIAATYRDFDKGVSGIIVFRFSGETLHVVDTPSLAQSIVFSADGTCLIVAHNARRAPFTINTLSIAVPKALVPVNVFPELTTSSNYCSPMIRVMNDRDDSFVVAHCREDEADNAGFTDILFVNADATTARTASVPTDVTALAWLGTSLCCMSFDGVVHLVGTDGAVTFVAKKHDE
jgi:hypothetical protein